MTITVLTPTLIEGTGEYQLYNAEFDCRTCAYTGNTEPRRFVWVPK
jgi:hypothetical protein